MREIIKFRGKIKGFSKFQDDLHDDPELYDIRELKKALTDIQQNNDPFIIAKTQSNRICLELRKELASSPKHIYIYLYK